MCSFKRQYITPKVQKENKQNAICLLIIEHKYVKDLPVPTSDLTQPYKKLSDLTKPYKKLYFIAHNWAKAGQTFIETAIFSRSVENRYLISVC